MSVAVVGRAGGGVNTVPVCRALVFDTEDEAREATARVLQCTRDRRRPYLHYLCGGCGCWHIGRRSPYLVGDRDERRRLGLVAAGWQQVNSPYRERWRRLESPRSRVSLDAAWAELRRRTRRASTFQEALATTRRV